MRAVVFERYEEPAEVREVADPVPAEHGVVVRVEATGLCRSDWHGWMGHDPDITLPHVPGHELAGTVEAVGARVAGWRPATGSPSRSSAPAGRVPPARRVTSRCASGRPRVAHWGSFAQYVALGSRPR